MATLGEVAKVQGGLQVSRARESNPVEIQYLRVANVLRGSLDLTEIKTMKVTEAEIDRTSLACDDLLIVEGHGNPSEIGRVARWDGTIPRIAHQNHLIRARCDIQRLDPQFASLWLNSPTGRAHLLRSAKTTSGLNTISTSQVKAAPIPLPPIEEQRRIAAILDHADALRAKRREALARLDELTQSIFIDMFGDPTRKQHWELMRFGDVCISRLGKMLDQKQQTGNHVRPYLRNANVQWFHIDTDDLLKMDFDEKSRLEFRLEPGDILMCEGGEPGRSAIWREPVAECYYQKALHRIRPNPDLLTPEYLVRLFWFLSKGGRLADHVTAATIAHLTGAKLKEMRIAVPPLDIQRQFVDRSAQIETVARGHQAALAELDSLFSSLQSRAFRGEL